MINCYENSEFKINSDDLHPEACGFEEEKEMIYAASFCKQFYYLLIRAIKETIRSPLASYLKILGYFIISIMVILIVGQLGTDSQSIQTRNGLLIMVCTIIIFNSIQSVVMIFPDEKLVFIKDQGSKLYSVTAYFLSKIVSEIPMIIINTNIISLLVYFICKMNLHEVSHFFIFYGYNYLLMWTCTGAGFFVGSIASNKEVALSYITIKLNNINILIKLIYN